MKVLDELIKKLPKRIDDYCRRIARSIDTKTMANIDDAVLYLSDMKDYPITYTTKKVDEKNVEYTVNVVGKQLAFLEFGTGIYNPPYSMGLSGSYIPNIVNKGIPSHGTYGKTYGTQYAWGFYRENSSWISSLNGDFLLTYRKYTRKDGTIAIYPLKKPVVITHGLAPQRMIYRAIRDTKKELEVAKKKWL